MISVDTFSQGPNARMVIEPKGLWEHSAYQADNKFILEVKPIQEDPNRLVQGTRQGYKGEKLSLNFQNIEVRAVLQVIADFTGLNIITSDTVTGSLTLRLKDIPWDQALDIIMQTKGLDMRKNGNVVLIAPREELALKEKQQLEAQIADRRARAAAVRDVPAQLHEGAGPAEPDHVQPQQQFGLGAGQTVEHRRSGLDPVEARRRHRRSADQHPVRHRHRVAARGGAADHPPDRYRGAPGADRGAHRRSPATGSAASSACASASRPGSRSARRYAVGLGGSLSTQPVVQHSKATG